MSGACAAIRLLILVVSYSQYPYSTKVGACADYLVGKLKVNDIAAKWRIKEPSNIIYWIRQRGCFRVRREHQRAVVVGAILLLLSGGNVLAESCIASHYGHGDGLQGSKTANGERFNTHAMTAAHKRLPFGTRVRVTHKGHSVMVRINDRGPFVRGRCIDLSYGAAKTIGISGLGSVVVEALP